MGLWIAVGLLSLLTLWLVKHPKKEQPAEEPPRNKVKITVTKMDESLLSKLPPPPPESTNKGVQVAASEIEKWFKQNPSLRDANKL